MAHRFRVGEVAKLTGVSVRTLHHYDRIGLLVPSARSAAGYRLYAEVELLRLQQILTLRYLGFALRQIGGILDRPDFDLVASLRIQRGAVRDRISDLERVEAVLAEALDRRLATGEWSWELVLAAAAAVQHGLAQAVKGADMSDYYTPEQMKQFEQVATQVSPEERQAIERQWLELIPEIRANRHLDPASTEARALADRWNALNEATMAGYRQYPELMAAICDNYRQNRFEDVAGTPSPEDFAFIASVNAARAQEDGAGS